MKTRVVNGQLEVAVPLVGTEGYNASLLIEFKEPDIFHPMRRKASIVRREMWAETKDKRPTLPPSQSRCNQDVFNST